MLIAVPYWFLNLAFFWGWVIADFHNAKKYGNPEQIVDPLYAHADYGYDADEYSDPAVQTDSSYDIEKVADDLTS